MAVVLKHASIECTMAFREGPGPTNLCWAGARRQIQLQYGQTCNPAGSPLSVRDQ